MGPCQRTKRVQIGLRCGPLLRGNPACLVSKDKKRTYARIARFYDFLDGPFERKRYQAMRPVLFEGLSGRLLDAGVGTGRNIVASNLRRMAEEVLENGEDADLREKARFILGELERDAL